MEVIHRHGIIHGDVREDDILYTVEGKMYIIDFAYSIEESEKEMYAERTKDGDMDDLRHVFWDMI